MFLGHSGGLDTDGNELPRLVYVSREKRPGFQHHKKAGAMNALVCDPHGSFSLLFSILSIGDYNCCKWCRNEINVTGNEKVLEMNYGVMIKKEEKNYGVVNGDNAYKSTDIGCLGQAY